MAKIPAGLNKEVAREVLGSGKNWDPGDQKRYDQLMKKRGLTDNSGRNSASTAAGMFNFGSLMEDYYGYSPDSDDPAGAASKRTFQENMIQSAFDSQLAMQNAAQAQEFELDAAKTYGDLELRNQKQLMNDTFKYGMRKMETEYNYQSRFAVDEAKRNLDTMTAAGQIQQNQTKLEGLENRMTLNTQGQIDLANIGAQG